MPIAPIPTQFLRLQFLKKNRVGANSDFEPGANFPEGVKICLKTPLSSVALMLSRPVMIVLELAKLAN
jgi:hypothetical protein